MVLALQFFFFYHPSPPYNVNGHSHIPEGRCQTGVAAFAVSEESVGEVSCVKQLLLLPTHVVDFNPVKIYCKSLEGCVAFYCSDGYQRSVVFPSSCQTKTIDSACKPEFYSDFQLILWNSPYLSALLLDIVSLCPFYASKESQSGSSQHCGHQRQLF